MQDEAAMQTAQALADAARRHTPPWPWVGCVITLGGTVVGMGATGPFPVGPHAEIAALQAIRGSARGSTLYTTLEPCDHDGNTPPCSAAIVEAGVSRVVIALEDPDAKVAGGGIARLRDAGIEVDVGVGGDQAAVSLRAYLRHRRSGRPLVVAKLATSLDGRISAADGSSRWVSGEAARIDAHRLRAESQAIAVGSGTALADRPALTVRNAPESVRPPRRVVLDGRGRVPASGQLFDMSLAPTLVLTTESAPTEVRDAWSEAGAEVEVLSGRGTELEPASALDALGRRGVLQVLIEGGPAVLASYLRDGVVDDLVVYVAPTVLGAEAPTAWMTDAPASIVDARRWQITGVRTVGDDLRVDFRPRSDVPAGT